MFVGILLQAQTPTRFQITEKDGLPDYEIYDLIEDKEGFIWIAANKGLYRYDGKEFLHFNHPKKRGLSVFGLTLDSEGKLWCNNISGQIFFIKDEKMELFYDFQKNISGKLPEFIVNNKDLLIATEEGLIEIDLKTKKKRIIKDFSIESSMYHAPFYYKNKLYLLHGLNLLTYNNNTFKKIRSFNSILSKGNYKISPLQLNNGILFSIYSNKQFFELYLDDKWIKIATPKELQQLQINHFFYYNNEIWIATSKGVFVYQINFNQEFLLKNKLLEDENCTTILEDKNHNFWFSTLDNGIFVIPNLSIVKTNSLKNEIISDFEYFDTNTLLFGTIDGKVGWINTKTLQTKIFPLQTKSKVTKIALDTVRDQIYISQENYGYVWNIKKNEIYNSPQLSLAKTIVITPDALIFGTYNKCLKLKFIDQPYPLLQNTSLNNIPNFNSKPYLFQPTIIRNKRTYTATSNNDRAYWVGYVDELYFYDNSQPYKPIKYNNKSVFAIDMVSDKTTWIATFENGLLSVNKNKITKSYSTNEGLLSNELGKIQTDSSFLWITTNKGLQRFNKTTQKFDNILKSDGLETYDYYDIQPIGNYLFLSSRSGVYRIDKRKSFKNNPTPTIFFTNIETNGINQKINNVYDLDFNNSSIKIAFNVTGFQKESFIDYEYRLLPQNKNWQKTDNGINFLRYNSLSVGQYIFEVRAKHKNGLPSKKKSIIFVVHAPFWQKWWFYTIIVIVILASSLMYQNYKNQKKAKEQQLTLEKTKIERELLFSQLENLRSQMNPHFIFNALNSIQEYIMTNEKDMASTYLVKFSRLIRMYLDHSRTQEVILENEINALQLYLDLEKDRFEDSLDYTIIFSNELIKQSIYIPSLFIQPYVENAIKHGLLHKISNRKLEIKFYLLKTILFCEVFDNGVGRIEGQKIKNARPENHQSFATSANEKRVDLLNKTRKNKIKVTIHDLYNKENQACGTKVIIEIPIKKNESDNN
ncbi:conserved hypothetical protein [Flavobacterium sp. 9AF]|nr:conserved hypothetical protein [Flavobacterium sp. 9AF]